MRINLIITVMLVCGRLFGQHDYPTDYFQAPVGIDMYLAGNFAELRSNHFHTGIDIKTNSSEGYKIYSCADGYVSRIKISLWGYGNVIYVDHPNGYTTVYAHMQGFNDEIDALIKEVQYYKQEQEVEIFPGKEQLPVKQGDVLGLSGNSGSSSAPHLHFEIRDTKTEEPINPLLFGFDIKDNVKPEAHDIRIYPLDLQSTVNGSNEPMSFELTGYSGNYSCTSEIVVQGNIGIAINAIDKLSGVSNKCGVYTIELIVDDEVVFKQEMEKLDFSTNRYINCHMDYELYKTNRDSYHKSYLVENNQLPIYSNLINDGRLSFDDNELHTVKYIITDAYGNESQATFTMLSTSEHSTKFEQPQHTAYWKWEEDNSFINDAVAVYLPKGSLYEDLYFNYTSGEQPAGTHAPLQWIHTNMVGVQYYYTLEINVGEIPEPYHDKLVVVSATENGTKYKYSSLGGTYYDGWISTRTRDFGGFTVMIDTVPPVITAQNISDGYNLTKSNYIEFSMADNLSGIYSYNGFIDDSWVLFEYDPKAGKVRYYFDEAVTPKNGESHTLRFIVSDGRGNESEFSCTYTR